MRPFHVRRHRAYALASLLAVVGCSGAPAPRVNTGAERPTPPVAVTGENVTDILRELDETTPSPADRALRDAVARYESRAGVDRLDDGDADGAINALRTAVGQYTPDEIARGALPAELAPLARGIVDAVSPRGDEAHALAATRVLSALASPDPDASRRFTEINTWVETNRRQFEPPWVYEGEVAEIYKEVARIVPATDIVQRAADLFVERRATAQRSHGAGYHPTSAEDFAQMRAGMNGSELDLAILYIRLGDIQGAADATARMHADARIEMALHGVASGEGGADDLFNLGLQFARADAAAEAGACRRGRRLFPQDARFAVCLAQAAASDEMLGLASAHLEAASQLATGDAETLRLAINASAAWLQSEGSAEDPAPGRRAYRRATEMLQLWTARFPHEHPPVNAAEVETRAAHVELAQANIAGAREHLESAMHATPPARAAYFTMAEIAWRKNEPQRAIDVLQQGLALPLQPDESDSTFRPQFLLQMGLTARSAGDTATATQRLNAANDALDALARSLTGTVEAATQLERAVALDALGRAAEVRPALDAALDIEPENSDLATRAVVFALGRGRWTDAREIVQSARARLQLDRSLQVYFALWGVIAARMSAAPNDGGASEALERVAGSASEHSPWIVRLAQRYRGAITRDDLARFAQDSAGHRAEASFYEGMLELAAGDSAAAANDLRAVVASDMLEYSAYDVAWQILSRGIDAYHPAPSASSALPPSIAVAASVAPTNGPAARPALHRSPRRAPH